MILTGFGRTKRNRVTRASVGKMGNFLQVLPILPTSMNICPNCHTERYGKFCHQCGQNDKDPRRATLPLMGEWLAETLELDGRVSQTFKTLILQPGMLSVAFSKNQRASFVSPLRLYFLVSLLFFFVMSVTSERTDLSALQGPQNPDSLDLNLDVNGTTIVTGTDIANQNEESEDASPSAAEETQDEKAPEEYEPFVRLLPEAEQSGLRAVLEQETLSATIVRNIGNTYLENFPDGAQPARAVRILFVQLTRAGVAPQATLDKLGANIPIAWFLLVPAFAALLKLFFWKGHYYIEHLVFALHLHTFGFLVFSLVALIPDTMPMAAFIVGGLNLALFLYCYKALRNYYQRSRIGTWIRYVLLTALYGILSLPAALLVLTVTLMMA